MNEQNIHFKRERANDGIHDHDLIVNGTDEGMDVKDCIFGCVVALGILVAYTVVAFLE